MSAKPTTDSPTRPLSYYEIATGKARENITADDVAALWHDTPAEQWYAIRCKPLPKGSKP